MGGRAVVSSVGSVVALSLVFGVALGTTGLLGVGAVSAAESGVSPADLLSDLDPFGDAASATERDSDTDGSEPGDAAVGHQRSASVPAFPERTAAHWDRLPLTDERDPGHETVQTDRSTVNTADVERHVADAVNEYRAANGFEPWAYSYQLASTARGHSYDMYDRGFFAHENPDGEHAWDRWGTAYCSASYGENLAETYLARDAIDADGDRSQYYTATELATETLELWQASNAHDELLRSEWADVAGVGAYVGEHEDGGYVVYVTLNVCTDDPRPAA